MLRGVGYVRDLGAPRQLQSADIGGNRPAVVRINAVGVGVHHAVAVGYHVKEMLGRCRGKSVFEVGGWARKAVRDDDAVAVAREAVARRAKNTETLSAARQQSGIDGPRALRRCCAFEVTLRDGASRAAAAPRCR